MIKKIFSEELIVVFLILASLLLAASPIFYELKMISCCLPSDRFGLLEGDFPPDTRVYLSRMLQGYQGQWLIKEKYTSEPHSPSLLHWLYLVLGKIGRVFDLPPYKTFPFWRIVAGDVFLFSGHFFLCQFFSKKSSRLAAFLLFIFACNLPLLNPSGVPFLGKNFSFALSWYTFFDPAKRLVFLPHYLFASAFLIFAFAFLKKGKFGLSGFFAFLGGTILPQALLIYLVSLAFWDICWLKQKGFKGLIRCQLPLFFWLALGLLFWKISLSYFPWNIQTQADLSKRGEVPFRFGEYFLGLGTGALGFLAAIWILIFRKKEFFLPALWLLAVLLLLVVLGIFPFSNQFRLTQIDIRLPLFVVLIAFLEKQKKLFFTLGVFLLLLPSFLAWPVSLKSQRLFIQSKIAAGWPLLPQKPYVVYPRKEVMEAIFWLGKNTSPRSVVLAGETAGSMIPAYAGNFVWLGHGHQTVNFSTKMQLTKNFYQGKMGEEAKNFLKEQRINFVFYGPEEAEFGEEKLFLKPFLKPVFSNSLVKIYQVEL